MIIACQLLLCIYLVRFPRNSGDWVEMYCWLIDWIIGDYSGDDFIEDHSDQSADQLSSSLIDHELVTCLLQNEAHKMQN